MTDIHITAEILRAIARGEVDGLLLEQIILTHLLELCPTCRSEIELFRAGAEPLPYADGSEYDAVFERLRSSAPQQVAALQEERREAQEDFKTLLGLPRENRLRRVERANRRFKSPFLAEMLLARARESVPHNVQRAGHMGEPAYVVGNFAPVALSGEIKAVALAHQGNAYRVMGALHEAREYLDRSRALIRTQGVVNTLVCAEVDWFEGVLSRGQRRFAAAEALLRRSSTLYEIAGAARDMARPLLSLGELLRTTGRAEEAVPIAEEVLNLVTLEEEPRLYFYAMHNRLLYLSAAGRHQEARDGLLAKSEVYSAYPSPHVQLRLAWLEGQIATGLDEAESAEQHFRMARDGFIHAGEGFDAALVSLDLAALLLKGGRTHEVKRLAEEIAPIFQAQDIHREAIAALVLFQNAARAEAASLAMVAELSTYLESVRRDPGLRFRG